MARRYYKVYGDILDTGRFAGTLSPMYAEVLNYMAKLHPVAFDRGVRAVAFTAQKTMKEKMRARAFGIAPLGNVQRLRLLDRKFYNNPRLRVKKFPGDTNANNRSMIRAIGYQHYKGKARALVGWLSNSAVRHARVFQDGGTKTFGDFFRPWPRGAGQPTKGTRVKVPARPFIPRFDSYFRTKILNIFVARVNRNLGNISRTQFDAELNLILNGSSTLGRQLATYFINNALKRR